MSFKAEPKASGLQAGKVEQRVWVCVCVNSASVACVDVCGDDVGIWDLSAAEKTHLRCDTLIISMGGSSLPRSPLNAKHLPGRHSRGRKSECERLRDWRWWKKTDSSRWGEWFISFHFRAGESGFHPALPERDKQTDKQKKKYAPPPDPLFIHHFSITQTEIVHSIKVPLQI